MNENSEHLIKVPAPNTLELLPELAKQLGGRLSGKKRLLHGGITLTRTLRTIYCDHKIELFANESLMCADVEARYGQFRLFMFNGRYRYGKPAANVRASGVEHAMFTIDGKLSPAQATLFESGILSSMLEIIRPEEGEQLDISQSLVRFFLNRPTPDRVMDFIHAVIELMPHEAPGYATIEVEAIPQALRPLIPWLTKWAIDDDEERSRKLKRSSVTSRQKLVDAVVPNLSYINEYLDSFGKNPPANACAFGSLAQAALEAQSLIELRRISQGCG